MNPDKNAMGSKNRNQDSKSNAKIALLIALIPIALFITTFFIQR
jgi:hypothetical protein